MTALRALLAGVVDYAGLFPPAALDMSTAVANYAAYRRGDDAWMLGRFVVPASRLGELAPVLTATAPGQRAWAVSALIGGDPAADLERIAEFQAVHGARAAIDSLEAKASDEDSVRRLAACAAGGRALFVEIPIAHDPERLVAAIGRAGLEAKVRTGGVTTDAIPAPRDVARFIRACVRANVPFKATAGLHHPLRASYRLTYASNAPVGTMFGFLNVFLAAAAAALDASDADVLAILEETDPRAFTIAEDAIAWRDRAFAASDLLAVRERVALSFGSCSFREPVDELRALFTPTTA